MITRRQLRASEQSREATDERKVEELQAEMKLKDEEAQSEIDNLGARFSRGVLDLRSARAELNATRAQLLPADLKAKAAENTVNKLSQTAREQSRLLVSEQAELVAAKQERLKLENRGRELSKLVDGETTRAARLQGKLAKVSAEFAEARKASYDQAAFRRHVHGEVEAAKSEVAKRDHEVAEARTELAGSSKALKDMRDKLKSQEAMLTVSRAALKTEQGHTAAEHHQMQEERAEVDRLRAELEALKQLALSHRAEEAESEVRRLQAENDRLNAEVEGMRRERETCQTASAEASRLQSENEHLRTEVETTKRELVARNKERETKQGNVLREEASRLAAEVRNGRELKAQLQKAEVRNTNLEAQLHKEEELRAADDHKVKEQSTTCSPEHSCRQCERHLRSKSHTADHKHVALSLVRYGTISQELEEAKDKQRDLVNENAELLNKLGQLRHALASAVGNVTMTESGTFTVAK
jgi:chromosome segregation ATPase